MDPGSSHQTDHTTNITGSTSNSPPNLIWVIIPLVVVLLTGALIAISYRLVTRHRRRKAQGADPEQAATGPETTALEVRDGAAAEGSPAPESGPPQPTDRWGWVLDPSSGSSSRLRRRGSTRISEGLNELGEAPPPYGEDSGGPKGCVAEMAEVGDGGEGPSGAAALRRGPGAGPEPPAYEMAMGSGGTSSVREPPPAVTPRSR